MTRSESPPPHPLPAHMTVCDGCPARTPIANRRGIAVSPQRSTSTLIFTYGWIKLVVPVVHPALYDQALWDFDQKLCFGISPTVFVLGLFGACLLYADGILTPAITVLGAIEGLDVATLLLLVTTMEMSSRDLRMPCFDANSRYTVAEGTSAASLIASIVVAP